MTGYAITAAAAALSASLVLQTQAFACPSSISTPTVALHSKLPPARTDANDSSAGPIDAGRPKRSDRNPQPMSVRNVRLLVLAALALGLSEEGDKATLSKRH